MRNSKKPHVSQAKHGAPALKPGPPANPLYTLTIPVNGYAPNSDILAANDSVNGNWTYSYDPLNRLAGSNKNSGAEVYSYAYDRFGNRWQQNGPHTMMLSFAGNNNRMDTYSYDAAGNLLNDGTTTYTYDAENRIISATNAQSGTSTYVYNVNGQRVRKTVAGVVTDFLYDLSGNQVAAVDGSGAWTRGEVYAAGRHLATYSGGVSGTTYFNFADWLGTERSRVGVAGTVYETCTSLPFGDWLTCSAPDSSPMHFIGKERDGESGLDNFGARYNASLLGRFMTPDSSPDGISIADPQSWNLYSYVRNRPMSFVDVGGNWATPVHGDITTFALQGYVSAGELRQLIARQYAMDKFQAPEDSFMHAMRNGRANQSNADATNEMWSLVANNMAGAAASLGANGSFSDLSLVRLGDAIHTVQDYTSPMHTSAAGELRPWTGMLRFGAVSHWAGESAPNRDWSRIGWAVRLTMAAFMQANPVQAAKHGLTQATFDREANNRVSQYVDWFYTQSPPRWGWEEDAARQCALGNRAAC